MEFVILKINSLRQSSISCHPAIKNYGWILEAFEYFLTF